MASRASETSGADENTEMEEEREGQMPQQEDDIERMQELFQVETKKYEVQMEKLSLLSNELKEL